MWPFTSRRIFGNRWWAVAFVVYVCYQAVDYIGSQPSADNAANQTGASGQTDASGDPVTDEQLRKAAETLNSF